MKTRLIDLRIGFVILFILVNIMVSTVAANAQSVNSPSADSVNMAVKRAMAFTERMRTELSLTDTQYPQVREINLKYAQKNEDIFKGSEGRFSKFKALKSSQKAKGKEMKAVLTSDQYKKYEAMVEEMKNKAMERYKGRSDTGN